MGPVGALGDPLATLDANPAAFDLDHQDASGRVDQDEVGFAVTGASVANRLPRNRVQHVPGVGETRQRSIDLALGTRGVRR